MLLDQDVSSVCCLCQSPVSARSYRDKDLAFCCAGCQAVYQILSSQNALENFRNHPLFQQAVQSGLIANPHLLDQLKQKEEEVVEEEVKKLHLDIQEMWCPSCAQVISLILLKEKGIRRCAVDYTTDLAVIEYLPRLISKERIVRLISSLGYRPASLQDPRQQAISHTLSIRFIVAAFFSLNIMMFAYPIYVSYFHQDMEGYPALFAWLSFLGSIPVLVYSAWPIWRRFYTGMRVGIWGMEALVVLGVSTATGLSLYELWKGSPYVYFDSMTVIIVFVLLGKIIESKAKFSAKDSLIHLTRALPRRGRKRMETGESQFVPLKDIQIGDTIIVLSGEKIVLDGVVEEGEGACDESLMTGEALPIAKKPGSTVLGGTFLQQGHLCIKVTAKPEETALARIIDMVGQDIEHKTQEVRPVDKIVKWFVPFVFSLALAILIYCLWFGVQDNQHTPLQTGILRAVAVLLISCPCAIGIAVPLAESHLLNTLAKWGVIVRNRTCLSFLGKETVFVFDKTGTITEGKYSVLKGLEELSFEEKCLLKGLVVCSNHPVAVALNQALLCPAKPFDQIEEIIGRGIRGKKQGCTYFLGSAVFLTQQGIDLPMHQQKHAAEAYTWVFFARNDSCLAAFLLGDRIRSEAKPLVQSLAPVKTMLVSGDLSHAVQKVAQACHFDAWKAEFHPLQKRDLIDNLRKSGEIVAMLGDGINDAPALTAAHVGIAVISATDISIQVSDLLLTTDRLQVLSSLRQLAKKAHRIVKQNLFWAFFYNCLGLGLAAAGALSPLFAAFAMVVSSLIVLFNAQRIKATLVLPKGGISD
ncbi:heavy metal translocating P-type ATPase [Candidatus Protochlamydia phocaeensis]|uniref:heavy metal translocating P-type ATPase n=1 Tax=Candidatus Protochlamydia phocaeensis TaxID=1414722 RepID=UPI000839AD5C|nr:heavy metal translocating P-type ATPase [Candidatus Protochlamydia phocaeensis]